MELRRIAIIGAGPMGLSLAALTSAHVPTVLVVRDAERRSRIAEGGIELSGALSATGRPELVASIDELAHVHPIDLVFIATKTTAIPEVCAALLPNLQELPFLVSYQNGIDPGRDIIRTLGTPRVVRMVLRYGATLEEPEQGEGVGGALRVHVGLAEPPHYVGGEGAASEFARALAPVIDAMGLPMRFSADIEGEAWRKGIENAAGNPVAALVQAPLGVLLESPARRLIERLLDEGISVARAAGVRVPPGYPDEVLARMAMGRTHLPSMAQDVRAGRQTEVTQLNEQISIRGKKLGMATPAHDTIVDLIRALDALATRGSR